MLTQMIIFLLDKEVAFPKMMQNIEENIAKILPETSNPMFDKRLTAFELHFMSLKKRTIALEKYNIASLEVYVKTVRELCTERMQMLSLRPYTYFQ